MIGYMLRALDACAHGAAGICTASLAALEYSEMLRLLERRGWKKEPSQTPLEFAAAIPVANLVGAGGAAHRAVPIRPLRQSPAPASSKCPRCSARSAIASLPQTPAPASFVGRADDGTPYSTRSTPQ